jgi:hypothetical protein
MASHVGEVPFKPMSVDDNDWAKVYQSLKQDIADVFHLMSPENTPSAPLPKTGGLSKVRFGLPDQKAARMPQLLRHRLQITVRTPDQAHFTIVDIPGLVSSTYFAIP